MKHLVLAAMVGTLLGCTGPDTTRTAEVSTKQAVAERGPDEVVPERGPDEVVAVKAEPVPAEVPAEPAKAEPVPAEVPAELAKVQPVPAEPVPAEPAEAEPVPAVVAALPAVEIPIKPFTAQSLTAAWRPVAEPGEALSLVDLNAGVLARAGAKWFQRGDGDTLVALEMDREPQLPVLGTWPSDAWMVESRYNKEELGESEGGYLELRLMKLRKGTRWTPQVYSGTGEQWWHPGTMHWEETHISALSGLLVYTDEFDRITRVAGKHPDPAIGPHRGEVVGFLETGTAEVYVLSRSPEGYLAQVDCADDVCVGAHAMRLPLPEWIFGRAVARGRHAVSVLATGCLARNDAATVCDPASTREFILHNHGKPDSWVLEELAAGERATGMWASAAGGLWTLAGERLRWRDTQGTWHDVALPGGLVGPSVALTEDRTQVWIAGQVAGASKVFAASANAPALVP